MRTVAAQPVILEAFHVRGAPAEAVLYWPAGQADALQAVLGRIAGGVQPARVAQGEAPAPSSAFRVGYVDPALAPPAAAYAASVGGEAIQVSAEGEWRGGGSDAPGVLLADLLDTPLDLLARAGCLGTDGAAEPVGVLHVDAHLAGWAHPLKNLLARLGALPRNRGRLTMHPGFEGTNVVKDGDERYLLGHLPPETLRDHLSRPARHLLALAHSSPFDSLLGQAVLCPLATDDGGWAPRVPTPGERALPCYAGGPCLRKHESLSLREWISPSAIAATHLTWLGCDLVLHRDSPYRSYGALLFSLLAAPSVVTVAGAVHFTRDTLDDLLHAGFLLDAPGTLGGFWRALNQFAARPGGPGAAGRILLGDPRIDLGAHPHAPAEQSAPAGKEGERVVIHPRAIRQRVRLADAEGAVRATAPEATVLGLVTPDGSARALEMLAFDACGRAPDAVELRPARTDDAPRLLEAWRQRTLFWRIVLASCRRRLGPHRGTEQPLYDACGELIAELVELENNVHQARVILHRTRRNPLQRDRLAAPHLATLERSVAALQPRLLSAVTRFAGRIDPRVNLRWNHSFTRGDERGGEACGCGWAPSVTEWDAGPGGMRRIDLRCGRCGTSANHELELRRPAVRLLTPTVTVGEPVRAVIQNVAQHGSMPTLIGAALRSEPGAEGALAVERCQVGARPGEVEVHWRMHPDRAAATQELYVYLMHDLAWHECQLWLHTARG